METFELHIPIKSRDEKKCKDCKDRFSCWTSNCVIIQAESAKCTRTVHETVSEIIFPSKECVSGRELFQAIDNHNDNPALFYGDWKFMIESQTLHTNFITGEEKLIIKARIL